MNAHSESSVLTRWDGVALLSVLALLVFWFIQAPGLPEQVPTHFTAGGTPDGWTRREHLPWMLFGLPTFNWLLFLAMEPVFRSTDQVAQLPSIRPARGLVTLGLCGMSSVLLLIPVYGPRIIFLGLVGVLISLGLSVWMAMRRPRPLHPGEDASHWVWGVFYVNAEDPRIWLPKRFGVGWTLNFGRPMGWVMLGMLLLPIPLVIWLASLR